MKKFKSLPLLLLILALTAICQACGGSSDGGGNSSDINYKNPKAYMNAVKEQNFEQAHEVLDNLYADYLNEYNKWKHASTEANRYWSAANYIYNAEMDYLLPQNDETANKRAVFTMVQMNAIGDEPISGHTYSGYDDNMGRYKSYTEFADAYNKLALKIIELALFYENKDVANTVLKSMKKGYTLHEVDSQYTWTVNTTDIDRAKELINKN